MRFVAAAPDAMKGTTIDTRVQAQLAGLAKAGAGGGQCQIGALLVRKVCVCMCVCACG